MDLITSIKIMKLHEAIEQLLKQKGRPMTTSEIANELNRNKWYTKKDKSPICNFQIHGRTHNYSHLFQRDGAMVSLIDQSFGGVGEKAEVKKSKLETSVSIRSTAENDLEKELMLETKFKSARAIDARVPNFPGLYCIRIKNPDQLPKDFSEELSARGNNIIYIGKASISLYRRLLRQELRARGHGTFFRSIGAVLGYKPPKACLVNKKNKRNFKFNQDDESKIIQWINNNLLLNWVEFNGNIEKVESELIRKYKPLLNIDSNPAAMKELRELRAECVRIATT